MRPNGELVSGSATDLSNFLSYRHLTALGDGSGDADSGESTSGNPELIGPPRTSTECYPVHGRANTNSVLPLLGRSSGVRRLKAPDVSERPVLTATYWRPSWA